MNKNIIQGRWYKINKKVKTKLIAKYHRIKDWRMDHKLDKDLFDEMFTKRQAPWLK